MTPPTKDVFVIHSKGDRFEKAMAEGVVDTLHRLGIPVYEYRDWTWSTQLPGRVRYRSTGSNPDPVRLASGHPEPFRTQPLEEVVDRHALSAMFTQSRVVLFLAPRSGQLSPGVQAELDALPGDCNLVLAVWDGQNDFLARRNRHAHLYRIARTQAPDVDAVVLDLVHLVWLQWLVDFLACDVGGEELLALMARQLPAVQRMAVFSGRVPRSTRHRIQAQQADRLGPADEAAAVRSLGLSMPAAAAQPIVAGVWRQICIRTALQPAPGRPVADLLRATKHMAEWFCRAAMEAHPALQDDWALGQRAGAAVAAGWWDEADRACNLLTTGLALPDLSAAVRSDLLADRAAISLRQAPDQALADIHSLLALDGARGTARVQALLLRAGLHRRQARLADAVADLSTAIAEPAADPLLLALCRHERATLQAAAGHAALALADLDALVQAPGLPDWMHARALLDRGVVRSGLGDADGELRDYGALLDMPDLPDDLRINAHFNRGIARMDRGERLGAVQDFVMVRDDPQADDALVHSARRYLDQLDPLRR